jgi:hypothetical protein
MTSIVLQKIGQGFCGTVWSDTSEDADFQTAGSARVLKREDGGPGRSLTNELHMHQRIQTAATATFPSPCEELSRRVPAAYRVNIPQHHAFLTPDAPEWAQLLPQLPSGFMACNALLSERIMPMSQPVRELLARKCFGDAAASRAQDKVNEHCLVRPYLGKRRQQQRHQTAEAAAGAGVRPDRTFFSVRNLPLHIDQMEALDLPVDE